MSNKLILLAEDNVINQKVAVRQLQKLGYRADAVANGREAIEALSRIPYDLVLMDCQMPEMDGYEATIEIRRREGGKKHTPIVAMTAHALEGDQEKCMTAGMDDYISKPVEPEDLAKILHRILDEPAGDSSSKASEDKVSPPVDMNRLHEIMGDELFEILDIYLVQMRNNLEKLSVAIEGGNAGEVNLIAHNCVGTSANCGMVAVVPSLRQLETAAREGRLEAAAPMLQEAMKQFERISLFLQTELNQLVA